MKKLLAVLVALLALPVVFGVDVGSGIGIDVTPEAFEPLIWMCDNRVVLEDCVEEGRMTNCPAGLAERVETYAFEGEQIGWRVLVMDKNKVEEIQDVIATIGSSQGVGNDVEVECARVDTVADGAALDAACNARIGEELLTTFDADTMDYYDCLLTVETPDSMYGEHFVSVEVDSADGEAIMDENEYWFLNPVIALSVIGDLTSEDVRPGSVSYSETLLVGNDADDGSGVMLDMFISGTDFYDPASSGAKCPTTNHLKLSQNIRSQASMGLGVASGATFTSDCDIDTWINTAAGIGVDDHDHLCYFASNGAYSTLDARAAGNADAEGYKPIVYSDVFTRDMYNDAEIISNTPTLGAPGYYAGNVLSPGAEMAITFKLGMPEPCVGDSSAGSLFFWGEAI